MNLSANELSIDASNSIDGGTIRGPLKTGGMTRWINKAPSAF